MYLHASYDDGVAGIGGYEGERRCEISRIRRRLQRCPKRG
jgi:hypothetical protein